MNLYWYAPFNNAYEHLIAEHIAGRNDSLVVQALRTRFRVVESSEARSFTFRRDLPELPSASGSSIGLKRSIMPNVARVRIAVERSRRRWSAVSEGDYDLLHLHTVDLVTDAAALPLLRRRVPTIVLSVHNVRPHVARLPHRLETAILGKVYASATRVLVAHRALRILMSRDFGLPPGRISLVPLPIPVVRNVDDRVEDPDSIRFLFFGTFRSNKGIPVVLQAIRDLEGKKLRFHFAGRGDAELERLVRQAAASDERVTAEIGYITEERRSELFRTSDVVLLPYTAMAAQSGVLSDAYGYGVPVIVSDVGALGDAVRDEATGWVVPPGDPRSLRSVMLQASHASGEREVIRRRMLALARGRAPAEVAKVIRAVYEDVLRR